jgi:hypothetical protein
MVAQRRTAAAIALLVGVITGCMIGGAPSAPPTSSQAPTPVSPSSLVIVGRIMTMSDPPVAEAILISGGKVAAVGSRDEVLARAGEAVLVIDAGENVAYPGFIDAHAHWIGDRGHYGLQTAEDAMVAALSRGWTSISEQWVNPERLGELEALAAEDALPLRATPTSP